MREVFCGRFANRLYEKGEGFDGMGQQGGHWDADFNDCFSFCAGCIAFRYDFIENK